MSAAPPARMASATPAATTPPVAGQPGSSASLISARPGRPRRDSKHQCRRPGGRAAGLALCAGAVRPMRLVSKMSALTNDPSALKVLLADRTSARNSVSARFLDSYLNHAPAPGARSLRPLSDLAHPTDRRPVDPAQLSVSFLDRITRGRARTVMFDGAWHYPLQQPGPGPAGRGGRVVRPRRSGSCGVIAGSCRGGASRPHSARQPAHIGLLAATCGWCTRFPLGTR